MLKKISIVNQIVIAVVLGVIVGSLLPSFSPYFKVIGTLFLRLVQMSIPILILGQIIQAVGTIEQKSLSKLGIKTILIFFISSLGAALFGIIVGMIFKVGSLIELTAPANSDITAQDLSISETILNFFPKNIFESLSSGSIIQIIVFALFFGFALNKYCQKNKDSVIMKVVIDINEIIILVIKGIMVIAPIGIFCLIASTISSLGLKIILPMTSYLGIYILATVLFLVIWIIVITLYTKINPITFIKKMKDISVMALATTSSAITLPLAMEDSKNKLGISDKITNLVLPLGMSLNSNGSAMHMAITVLTISNMYGIAFGFDKIIYVVVASTFISLANAVVPGAGLVSLAIIVPQMGLPVESIAIFAGVEWFVGMTRTILNVNSDVYTAVLVAKSENEINYDKYK